jgi:zinc transporter ZupT
MSDHTPTEAELAKERERKRIRALMAAFIVLGAALLVALIVVLIVLFAGPHIRSALPAAATIRDQQVTAASGIRP